jgi:hypothetical protein
MQLCKNAGTASGDPFTAARLVHWMHGLHPQDLRAAQWAASSASPDDPYAVARLLDSLRAVGAGQQVATLADRAAASTPLDDPNALARLLDTLEEADADQQVATLLARDPAASTPLDDPYALATLLHTLEAAAADQMVATLADRAAASTSLDGPNALARLLHTLEEAGPDQQVATLRTRLPPAGLFGLFLKGADQQFRFGREPDGAPAKSWGWTS